MRKTSDPGRRCGRGHAGAAGAARAVGLAQRPGAHRRRLSAGGGTDALARVVGAKLTEMWKQQVIVENKAGAAGVLAAEYMSQQPADGSTLLMAHINSHALAPSLQPGCATTPNATSRPSCWWA
jgi:tripartite-type tricarboxylate transporter receptor subunit TctC